MIWDDMEQANFMDLLVDVPELPAPASSGYPDSPLSVHTIDEELFAQQPPSPTLSQSDTYPPPFLAEEWNPRPGGRRDRRCTSRDYDTQVVAAMELAEGYYPRWLPDELWRP